MSVVDGTAGGAAATAAAVTAEAAVGAGPGIVSGIVRAGAEEPCRPWPRRALSQARWRALGEALAADPGAELLALWADPLRVHALLHADGAHLLASVPVERQSYPALSPHRPSAAWFERMIADLWGHRAEGAADARPFLDHGAWTHVAPMSVRAALRQGGTAEGPEFLPAEGEGVQQVPVGPVHAGIIEPGHFRFHTSGETVVRLEVRLGYTHKGTLALMRGKSPRAAARYAARLSGDSTVAHSVAFARAAEAACGTDAPPRAQALRGVMAELERLANHLGDVGAIAGDAAFARLPAAFGRLRELVLRGCAAAFGHRLMMDAVVPGGVVADIAEGGAAAILRALDHVAAELPALVRLYDRSATLADRMLTTGVTDAALVARYAAGGVIGRAAGRSRDLRVAPGYPPYEGLHVPVPTRATGDVDARVRVRLDEIVASKTLVRGLLAALPDGPVSVTLPMAAGEGIGWAEGFRGDIWHWLRLDGGLIAAAFPRDPSWLQWPLLEAAIEGNILADFPLCNKSFNCSYSGVDL